MPENGWRSELLRPVESLDTTVVAIGSHDVTLDLIASELRRVDPRLTLASSNVGSLGGLLALRRGEAHVAGTHLLDEETGEYNVSYVRRYGPERAYRSRYPCTSGTGTHRAPWKSEVH